MNKNISFLIALILSIQTGNSQGPKFSMSLTPEASWTNKILQINCVIQNSSNKVVKVIPLSHNCESKYYPSFWKIHVKSNDHEYDTDTIVILGQPAFKDLIKIQSGSKYEFKFCIDFSTLIPVNGINDNQKVIDIKNIPKTDKNLDLGLYRIQLEYLSNLKIKKQLVHLISNEISIIYK
jgi:hypothetical protein